MDRGHRKAKGRNQLLRGSEEEVRNNREEEEKWQALKVTPRKQTELLVVAPHLKLPYDCE